MDEIIKRMNGDRVSKIDCFAYKSSYSGADCTILNELDCMDCPFYKSRERVAEEEKKINKRLIELGLIRVNGGKHHYVRNKK